MSENDPSDTDRYVHSIDERAVPIWLRPLPEHLDDVQLDFLRQEYGHLAELFVSNEESGEKRVSLYISFVGPASAAIGIASDSLADSEIGLPRFIADAGHFLHQERPEQVNRILLQWLTRHD